MAGDTPTTPEVPAATPNPSARTKSANRLLAFADDDDRAIEFPAPVTFAEAIDTAPGAIAAVPLPNPATAPGDDLAGGPLPAGDAGMGRNAQEAATGDFLPSPMPCHSCGAVRAVEGREMAFAGIRAASEPPDFLLRPKTTLAPTASQPPERTSAARMGNTLSPLDRPLLTIRKSSREVYGLTIRTCDYALCADLRDWLIDEESGDLMPTPNGILIDECHLRDVIRGLSRLLPVA